MNDLFGGYTIDTPEEMAAFMYKIQVREAAFNAVYDGIIDETDDAEIVQYLSVIMTHHDNDISFYNALVSELRTGDIRSAKEGEPQPTRDISGLEFVLFQR